MFECLVDSWLNRLVFVLVEGSRGEVEVCWLVRCLRSVVEFDMCPREAVMLVLMCPVPLSIECVLRREVIDLYDPIEDPEA